MSGPQSCSSQSILIPSTPDYAHQLYEHPDTAELVLLRMLLTTNMPRETSVFNTRRQISVCTTTDLFVICHRQGALFVP